MEQDGSHNECLQPTTDAVYITRLQDAGKSKIKQPGGEISAKARSPVSQPKEKLTVADAWSKVGDVDQTFQSTHAMREDGYIQKLRTNSNFQPISSQARKRVAEPSPSPRPSDHNIGKTKIVKKIKQPKPPHKPVAIETQGDWEYGIPTVDLHSATHEPLSAKDRAFPMNRKPARQSTPEPNDPPAKAGAIGTRRSSADLARHVAPFKQLGNLSLESQMPSPPQLRSAREPEPGVQSEDDSLSDNEDVPHKSLTKQPDSRPISQEQLGNEVKEIYAGLVVYEAKCVNVVNAQLAALKDAQAGNASSGTQYHDHWQALTALHRTLLHEHHDFFLASQHPSAAPQLRELATKYAMPARMWRHGIHSYLELLRQRLPYSLEFMLCFIYQAYNIITLLYETIPTFQETWIECLGDLARYRMAVEDEDPKIRQTWTSVASYWYIKAADKNPRVGRLYHHLAILARTQALYQLSLYCRALNAVVPFMSARDSIMCLLEPILAKNMVPNGRSASLDSWFIRFHALLFTQGDSVAVQQSVSSVLGQLGPDIDRMRDDWRKKGTYIAICNIASFFLYGNPKSTLRNMYNGSSNKDERMPDADSVTSSEISRSPSKLAKAEAPQAWSLAIAIFEIVLARPTDTNVKSYAVVFLSFIWSLTHIETGSELLEGHEHIWQQIANYLNIVLQCSVWDDSIESPSIPTPVLGEFKALPEDFAMRGLVWSQPLYPTGEWFAGLSGDDDERTRERKETDRVRTLRVLFLGVRLARVESEKRGGRTWLSYDAEKRVFSVSN